MRFIQAAIAFYVIGIAVILLKAWFYPGQYTIWDDFYFTWDKTKDFLFLLCIMLALAKSNRWIIRPFLIFSFILIIWQILRALTDWDINHPTAVKTVISGLLASAIIVFAYDLIHRKRK